MYNYLILDELRRPIAHCTSSADLSAPMWRLDMDEEDRKRVEGQTLITLVGTSEKWAAAEGKIVRWRDGAAWVERVQGLGSSVRENLRIPVRFTSFLYPISGSWKGRRPILSKDLSCGGVAFYCGQTLQPGENAQIVIPVTSQPLLLRVKILRQLPNEEQVPLYAAEFVDLLREEESMVREAVFSLQIRHPTD